MYDTALCESFDGVQLNFSPTGLFILDITLCFIMFGVALDLRVGDFLRVIQSPQKPLLGLLSQWLVLPALTFGLVWILKPCPSMALGMFLVAACPGGNISNFMASLAKGNVALSVSLSAISTMGAIVMTPLNFAFWASKYPPAAELLREIELNPWDVVLKIVMILGLPLLAGMFTAHRFEAFAKKISKPIRRASIVIFGGYVVAALASNFDFFLQYVHYIILIVFVHNLIALLSGYGIGLAAKLPEQDRRTLSIETGIQNSGLALVLIFSHIFDGLGGMAMIAAMWGIWHILSGLTISFIWAKREPKVAETI
ncbi:bile acid:sodium symporter family protein [Pontibacter sp. G13]|uniref:bile acid:sodium symporter family protein n=1 Tax=Pontibacter sp. G13 TaxID=3074898 RepID=UPI00288AB749|nr:bile acid:sodium symporter family protein [Pontibacter sp. G13]WNJ20804.1 bile acid:sodium symporter family protein [Pontibacter sp. G13]